VEHRDKGRLELNFVIPNIELQSGKRLQPYFDRADRPRVNAWQTLTNDRLGLRDPNDPTYRRPLTQASDLPRDKQQAAEKITAGLMNLMQQGVIRSRQDVVTQLESYGLTVARETKSSISIADPDGGRNIRLKGMIYERDFKFGEGLRGEIEAAGAGYRAEREARVREAGDVYQRGTAIKLAEHQQRYPRAERQADGHAQEVSLNSDGVDILLLRPADRHPGRDNLVSGHDHHLAPERDGQLQPAAGEPESEKRRGRDDLQRRHAPEHLPGGAAEAGARRGNLHVDDRQHRGEIHGEITPQSALKRHSAFLTPRTTKTMTEMEKQLLSALESLQTSYEQQQQAWQDSYSSLQHMFEATSQALTHSDRVCQHLSSQVDSLRAQVESLSRNVSRLMR
jgi:hypothetical protein